MSVTQARKIRSPEDYDRFRMAILPVDQAFFQSEQRWGVGRLERLVSLSTLQAYRRGWDAYRIALDDCDGEALEQIGPKMITALAFMDAEATAAGHQPLAPDTWEAALPDGRVLCVVRTQAEASAVIRASQARDGASYETTIPPDLAMTVRSQHEGRALVVVTMSEIARLLTMAEGKVTGTVWEGNATHSGRQNDEMSAHDQARSGYPLKEPLAVGLNF
jgi:hypothetical protein